MTGQFDARPVALPGMRAAVSAALEFQAAMIRTAAAINRVGNDVLARLQEWADSFTVDLAERANHPVTVAGLEARYAVRASLSPAYRDPADLDRLVAAVMAGHGDTWREDRDLRHVSRENRSLIAAAAIRGWCYSYGDGPAILAWHRLMGTTTVVVTRT